MKNLLIILILLLSFYFLKLYNDPFKEIYLEDKIIIKINDRSLKENQVINLNNNQVFNIKPKDYIIYKRDCLELTVVTSMKSLINKTNYQENLEILKNSKKSLKTIECSKYK